jgi:hypothetical protein
VLFGGNIYVYLYSNKGAPLFWVGGLKKASLAPSIGSKNIFAKIKTNWKNASRFLGHKAIKNCWLQPFSQHKRMTKSASYYYNYDKKVLKWVDSSSQHNCQIQMNMLSFFHFFPIFSGHHSEKIKN